MIGILAIIALHIAYLRFFWVKVPPPPSNRTGFDWLMSDFSEWLVLPIVCYVFFGPVFVGISIVLGMPT